MTARTATALMAMAVTSLALAACGGDGGSGGGKSEEERMEEYALNQAECMRRHGFDVPDPKPGRGLEIDKRDVKNPEEFRRAQRACQEELGKPPVPELSDEEQREVREAGLNYSRCMRAHGIGMSDPIFGANGEARVRVEGSGRTDLESDPAFRAAEAKCRKYQKAPKGG